MLENVRLGAGVSMRAEEANDAAGAGPVRLVSCENGRVVGGVGAVGFAEHTSDTDLQAFMDGIKSARAELADMAKADPKRLFAFTRI